MSVEISHPEKVLFPDDGITKGDLFAYYGQVADAIVPHLRQRPFTMKRWREGLPGGAFFQKQAPKGIPSWIETFSARALKMEALLSADFMRGFGSRDSYGPLLNELDVRDEG